MRCACVWYACDCDCDCVVSVCGGALWVLCIVDVFDMLCLFRVGVLLCVVVCCVVKFAVS